ncbi:hypothetical protein [uncultured Nisaea sp.]|uniref:hypothetical protein n=1 Tax=uncultured Nisaea sp. TaxID=538215 RepID=UPI0030EE70AE
MPGDGGGVFCEAGVAPVLTVPVLTVPVWACAGDRIVAEGLCWPDAGCAAGGCACCAVLETGCAPVGAGDGGVACGSTACGAVGKVLLGFRCGLDASRYRAAAWAACCGLILLAVAGIGPPAMPWGSEVGRKTMARATCPSASGGNVLGAEAVVAVALPVAAVSAC